MVKGDSTELLPVGDERGLSDDFVQRNITLHFALVHATIGYECTQVTHTSRNLDIGAWIRRAISLLPR
jgi:hypothetical protein